MRIATFAALGFALAVAPSAGFAQGTPKTKADLKTDEQKFAYGIGLDLGRKSKQQGLPIDASILAQGVMDGLADKAMLTDAEIQAAVQTVRTQMMAKMNKMQSEEGDKTIKDGDAYLAANKAKPGVITLPSGVQYKVLKVGKGATPKLSDTVKAIYTGTLVDGTKFDATADHGGIPFDEFEVGGVIPGWTEVLQKMKVGDKWQIVLPPKMAYGPRGAGEKIKPNSTLLFDIELVGIK